MKNENGIISLIVLFIMLFLLIFTLTVYSIISDKEKVQISKDIELQQMYSKNGNEIERNLYAENDSIIPIYNVNEFKTVGTGSYSEIKGKIYQCSINKNYELQNNIIVDVNEDLRSVNIGFYDYKFYSDTYNINKQIYDYFYFYNNSYWKAVAYQKFDKDSELIKEDVVENNKFSILNKYDFRSSELEFLEIIKNEKGEIVGIYQEKQSNLPRNLDGINVFRNHMNELDTKKGEFYILVKDK